MKVVITGSNGQLGRSINEIIDKYPEIDAVFTDIDKLDITNRENLIDFFYSHKCDILINCAAYTAVDQAESENAKAEEINSNAVKYLAEAGKKYGFKIIHISTDYVFDGTKKSAYSETDSPNPKTIYGKTKLMGEEQLRKILPDSIIIRTAWLYSQYGKNFFLTMMSKAFEGNVVNVVNDQKGSPTFAGDLAKVILEIINRKTWVAGTYNYTNEGFTTWFEFTKEIFKLYHANPDDVKPISTQEYNSVAKRPLNSQLDKTKIKHTFGIEIPGWKESLKKLVNLENGIK